MAGLEKAIDVVEMEEEKQDHLMHPPQPSPQLARKTPGRTPQMLQRITEGEGKLAREEKGGKSRSEKNPRRPQTSKGREEAKGTSRTPLGRAERGSPSSRNAKIVGNKQEEEPTREDPQAQGQPATKEG